MEDGEEGVGYGGEDCSEAGDGEKGERVAVLAWEEQVHREGVVVRKVRFDDCLGAHGAVRIWLSQKV